MKPRYALPLAALFLAHGGCTTATDNADQSDATVGRGDAGAPKKDASNNADTGTDPRAGDEPGPSACAALLEADPSVGDGKYMLDLDGDGPGKARSYYCDMSGGGWTLIANQAASQALPDERTTVNESDFGSLSANYRLGLPEVAAIEPTVAWKLTDAANEVFFRPSCVVDWDNNFTNDTEPTDCTTGYTSTDFSSTVNPGWVRVSARGIGVNNSGSICSIRIFEAHFRTDGTEESSARPAGEAAPCDYYDKKQRVSLWFK
jgi:hypothetical protein